MTEWTWEKFFSSECTSNCKNDFEHNGEPNKKIVNLFNCFQNCTLKDIGRSHWRASADTKPNEEKKDLWTNISGLPSVVAGTTKEMASQSVKYAVEQTFLLTEEAVRKAQERNMDCILKVSANVGVATLIIETHVEKRPQIEKKEVSTVNPR